MSTLKIRKIRSEIGRNPKQRATLRALGLGKVNSSVEQVDRPSIRGMIRTVQHLIHVEETSNV